MSAAESTRIDASLSVRDHQLFIEGVGARELADRFGTPLYVISEDQLRRNVAAYIQAFASWVSTGSTSPWTTRLRVYREGSRAPWSARSWRITRG